MDHKIEKIALVGIGGGGMNTLHGLMAADIPIAKYIVINRNKLFLNRSNADVKIKLDAPKNNPDVIVKSVQKRMPKIKESLSDMDAVVLVTGLGGMTGTYASPEIARIATALKLTVWAVVVMPFEFEGSRRGKEARKGFEKLSQYTNAIRCVKNQELIVGGHSVSMLEAFKPVDLAVTELIGMLKSHEADSDGELNGSPNGHIYLNPVRSSSEKNIESNEIGLREISLTSCCSFCAKSISEVNNLIVGPSVFICNECVERCAGMISKQSA